MVYVVPAYCIKPLHHRMFRLYAQYHSTHCTIFNAFTLTRILSRTHWQNISCKRIRMAFSSNFCLKDMRDIFFQGQSLHFDNLIMFLLIKTLSVSYAEIILNYRVIFSSPPCLPRRRRKCLSGSLSPPLPRKSYGHQKSLLPPSHLLKIKLVWR